MQTAATVPCLPSFAAERRRPKLDILPVGTHVGAWHIDEELGRGGMASVYAVTHKRFGKRAALKLAHPSIASTPASLFAFEREARIVHAVNHAGVTDVFATGKFDGRPYLVMERLAGKSLSERRPDRAQAIEVLRELCQILTSAHKAGIVHRDLTLSNVFLLDAPYAGSKRVKLIDWGVAHVDGDVDPLVGMIAGTLTYVAPEQIRGDQLTPMTDVYSLGVVAYELLLGKPPFTSPDDLELLRKHLHKPPFDPRAAWGRIPEQLATTLVAMLAKNPADRPPLAEVDLALASAAAVLAAPMGNLPDRVTDVLGRPTLVVPQGPRWLAPALAAAVMVMALIGSM